MGNAKYVENCDNLDAKEIPFAEMRRRGKRNLVDAFVSSWILILGDSNSHHFLSQENFRVKIGIFFTSAIVRVRSPSKESYQAAPSI